MKSMEITNLSILKKLMEKEENILNITVGEAFKYLPSLNSGGGEEIQQIHYYYEEEYKNNKISEGFYEYINLYQVKKDIFQSI